MDRTRKRTRVLLSCYACEPNQGSEPGVGWNWTKVMSKENDLVVVTRANNQKVIEKNISQLEGQNVEFVYYDLPKWLLVLKKKRILKTSLYYAFWQLGIRRKMKRQLEQFDIVHHMTFNMFLCPGYWRPKKAKLILGPLGGGSCVPEGYLSLFGKKAWVQKIRKIIVNQWRWVPTLKKTFDRADVILCANEDTYRLLEGKYADKLKLHLETGYDGSKIEQHKITSRRKSGFVQIGNIEARKGWRITLLAAHQLVSVRNFSDFKIEFIGSGPEAKEAHRLVIELGLEDVITFHGRKSLAETQEMLKSARALLFPSVRDTSGNVVLEAMSQGVPVVCIAHQGAKEMTDDSCSIRMEPSYVTKSVEYLADAILRFQSDDDLVQRMGESGMERVKSHFTWTSKQVYMQSLYDSLIDNK